MRSLELFGCSGGMAEGFRRAGIVFDAAIDKSPVHCESYGRNIGRAPRCADVNTLDLRDGEYDLIVADPPCTPWSIAGKRRGLEDPRDCLRATCALISRVRPRVFVVGNVPGLDTPSTWPTVQRTLGAIAGYRIDYARLNAADYGVPQIRRRPFWVGHRLDRFRWPAPTHYDPRRGARLFGGGRPWVTCREALAHLPEDARGIRVSDYRESHGYRMARPDAPSPCVRPNGGRRSGGASMIEWPWDRPATTVVARHGIGAFGRHDLGWSSHPNAVILSLRAAMVLQGLGDAWHLAGSKTEQWSQLGQAVPPPLAQAVARSIAEVMR